MNGWMWLGPLAILIVWAAYLVVYFLFDKSGHTTLSAIGASTFKSYLVFSSGLFISGILIFLFIRNWFIEALELPNIFLYISAIATLFFQPIIAFVPLRGRRMKPVHNAAAYIEMMLMPFLALFIVLSRVMPGPIRFICAVLLGLMVYLVFEFKKQFLKPRFIWVQGMFTGSFHIIILLATLTRFLA